MNHTVVILTAASILFTAVVADAMPNEDSRKQLEQYPKNMARQHVGTNLFAFDTEKLSYEPAKAAAAWLDDDISTGWPPMAGKNYYLLALPEAELITNFTISANSSVGKINLYAGDEIALPDSGSWSPVARDLDISQINGKKLGKPFSRFAKYLLIETDITEAGRWYSLYAYGTRPAVGYSLKKRDTPIDSAANFGCCNDQTAISLSSLYTGARVMQAATTVDVTNAQRAIDDNPESSISIAPSNNKPGMVIEYGSPVNIQRVSLLTNGEATGKFDIYLLETLDDSASVAWNAKSHYLQVANSITTGPVSPAEIDLSSRTPTATVIIDGSSSRSSIEIPSTNSAYMLVQWKPDDGSRSAEVEVSEVNSFGPTSLDTSTVTTDDPGAGEPSENIDGYSKDGKTLVDFKDGKKAILPAVGELLPTKTPFVPGALGIPVILNDSEVPTSP
jgi:hypothetical protein